MNLFKKSVLAAGLAASALVATTPAMARDYYRGGGDPAAAAVGAGIVGLAVGALIASSHPHDRYYEDGYYDDGYYGDYDVVYAPGWSYRDGWYWDHDGRRFSREDYFRRNPGFRPAPRPNFAAGPDRGPAPADAHRGYDRDAGQPHRGF